MSGLERGDILVCAFHRGPGDNLRSKAPDDCLVLLDDQQTDHGVDERVAYVCTVKSRNMSQKTGRPYYIVRKNEVIQPAHYDRVLNADFERNQFHLALRHPTYFKSRRTTIVDAETTASTIRTAEGDLGLRVTLRYGRHERSIDLSMEEALRRGHRIGFFVPPPPPAPPPRPGIHHPQPSPEAWLPTPWDHTGYLLQDPMQLHDALQDVRRELGDAVLVDLARKRITQVLAVAAIDGVSLDTQSEAHLEHALTHLARSALHTHEDARAGARLHVAEQRLLAQRLRPQGPAELAGHLQDLGYESRPAKTGVLLPIRTYLELSRGQRDGDWSLGKLPVQAGLVTLEHARAVRLLQHLLPRTAPPIELAGFVAPLRRHASRILAALDAAPRSARRATSFGQYPPCIRHILRTALDRGLWESEAYLAHAYLHHQGLDAATIHRALYNTHHREAGRYETPTTTGRTSVEAFRCPPCAVNRVLGTCTWTCPGTESPLSYTEAANA